MIYFAGERAHALYAGDTDFGPSYEELRECTFQAIRAPLINY